VWRTFIPRIALRYILARRPNTLNQRLAQIFKLHDLRLLRGHNVIKVIQQLVMVSRNS
jgi:hypothetical protein